jgi:DNA-binding CsgD family transcriptional regulator
MNSTGDKNTIEVEYVLNLNSASTSPLAFRIRELARSFDAAGFTAREREVALLLCERLSIGEIGERLFVSRKTVAKHLEHIYSKLGLHSKRHVYEELLGKKVRPSSRR